MALGNRKQECILADYEAESAVSEGYAVTFGTSDDQCDAITALDTVVMGINRYGCAIGERAEVVVFGPCTAVAGAAIAPGDLLEADAAGRLIPIAAPSDGHYVGKAFGTAAALGDLFTVLVGVGK